MGWCRNLVALVAMSLASTPLRADPASDAFDLFRAELAARVAELSGELTPTESKERAALDKIGAALAAPSSGLADDVKMAQRVAKLVKKSALRDSPLVPRFLEALGGLLAHYGALVETLRSRAVDLPEGALRDKALAALDKVDRKLDAAGGRTDPVKLVQSLLRVEKNSDKAEAKVEKGEQGGGGGGPGCDETGSFTGPFGSEDGAPAHHVRGFLTVLANGRVNVVVRGYDTADESQTAPRINVGIVNVFTGPGPYVNNGSTVTAQRVNADGTTFNDVSGTGSITIDVADPETGEIRGSFDLDGIIVGGSTVRRFAGTFVVTCATVVRL